MNKKVFYIIIVFFSGCNYFNQTDQPVARVNDRIIYKSEIDSIMMINVRKNQMLALNSIIETEKQKTDSKKRHINTEKTGLITNSHIADFDFFIPKPQFNFNELQKLNSYDIINNDAKNTLIILFNYDCPFCRLYDQEIRALSDKYRLNLKYIYVTDYVGKKALFCDAAGKQNKYWEVHDLIINQELDDYSEFIKLVHLLELDTIKLKNDIEDPKIIESHLKNRDVLINMGFETVPAYIIKNCVFHDPKSIELVLEKEGKI